MKNLTIWKYTVFIFIFLAYGCSVNASIRKDFNIEMNDGINTEEAILIAIAYVEKDNYYKKYYSLLRSKVKDSILRENCWAVEFSPNIKGILKAFYPLQISVDKNTGKIKGVGATK